ncbi:hypothetical protein CDD80_3855 [Ophiocordyceps camponoti-rufipedis]|uniref:Uncharacterized protein n=1 Tax=Ophiocordyceps camponoti-rufipedis TaxID=2004952 RepID=A0A2C5Z149_9HYPO|nr:hypothetical protein CDD80_3855 [Ophiocordyceps camponoti-rufipedis]
MGLYQVVVSWQSTRDILVRIDAEIRLYLIRMHRAALAGWIAGVLTVKLLAPLVGVPASVSWIWKPETASGMMPEAASIHGIVNNRETVSFRGRLNKREAASFDGNKKKVNSLNGGTLDKQEHAADHQILKDMYSALSAMQNNYYESSNADWPAAIDWTNAVVQTIMTASISTLSRSFNSSMYDVAAENLISTLYSQMVNSFMSQNVGAIRGQANDDILWVVLGWLEAIKFFRLHSQLHHPVFPERFKDCDKLPLPDNLDEALHKLPWHGYHWMCRFAERAREFWVLASFGWTPPCSGGMTWDSRYSPYKNAITNELWISASVGLHQQLPDMSVNGNLDRYMKNWEKGNPVWLTAAIEGYKWLKAINMTNDQGLIVDGYHISIKSWMTDLKCDQRNEAVYTYNQGVLLSGLRGLWSAKENGVFLDDGHALVKSVMTASGWDTSSDRPFDVKSGELPPWQGIGRGGFLEEACDAHGDCNQDAQTFKGIFFHHLAAFCAPIVPEDFSVATRRADMEKMARNHVRECRSYLAWMKYNVEGALAARDDQGRFGMWWGASGYGINGTRRQFSKDDDPNSRGRGRTVETQVGGLALLRAYWEIRQATR